MQILNDIDLLNFTGMQESQYFVKPSELIEKIKNRLNPNNLEFKGDLLPWNKTHNHVRLRPSEVSLWCGINGHGKSQLLGQVTAWNLRYKKWLIASMEMSPEATMERMTRQIAGCRPSDEFIEKVGYWTDDKLWVYDQTDTVKMDRILAVVYYAAMELKINHIVIDSMMKCGIKKDDFNTQVYFVDKLCWCAKTTKCHIHLVHHIRKGDKESIVPDKFDIRGATEITDLVDNVFIIHRNKAKEIKLQTGKQVDPEEADCSLIVAKQRHGEWEGMFKLWFNPESKQYTSNPGNRVMGFVLV